MRAVIGEAHDDKILATCFCVANEHAHELACMLSHPLLRLLHAVVLLHEPVLAACLRNLTCVLRRCQFGVSGVAEDHLDF
jgi:hypothetical protein